MEYKAALSANIKRLASGNMDSCLVKVGLNSPSKVFNLFNMLYSSVRVFT